jgi:hypothetical protein
VIVLPPARRSWRVLRGPAERHIRPAARRDGDRVASVVAGLTARGDDRSAAAVEHANHERVGPPQAR